MRKLDPSIRISNMGRQLTVSTLPWVLVAFSIPAVANPIDLSQLCGASDCVVSVNTTIGSASGPLTVNGNFTVNSGVALEFLVDTQINIDGNLNLQGVVGGPGNGGVGGVGGGSGLPGSPGGNAPSVVSSLFNVKGSITVGSGGVTAEGGSGGSGGTAGSLTFNTVPVIHQQCWRATDSQWWQWGEWRCRSNQWRRRCRRQCRRRHHQCQTNHHQQCQRHRRGRKRWTDRRIGGF